MIPSELEAMVRNLNTRTTAIEQILPTLATKDDLKNGLATTLAEAKQFTMPLYEDAKGRLEILAQHLANVPTGIRQLAESLARMSPDLSNRLDQLAQKIDSPRRRR